MRILRGKWRGRAIDFPGAASTRPLSARAREALFNTLESRWSIPGKRVLDLFAGSGAVGLEFLSRGAAHCTFVEKDPVVLRHLRQLVERWGISLQVQVVAADVLDFLAGPPQSFDFIYIGSPYRYWKRAAVLEAVRGGWIGPGGCYVLEHPLYESYADRPGFWRAARYLSGLLSFFVYEELGL